MALGNRRPSRESNGGRKDMRGKLWPNTRKSGDKSPDYTGVCTVDGRDYRISLWEDSRDETLSVAFKDKAEDRRDNYERGREAQRPSREYDDRNPPPLDDEINF